MKPAIIWITGQAGSGKTTIGKALSKEIGAIHLDGDEWRFATECEDYTPEGRIINVDRAHRMAKLLYRQGFTVVASFVSPFEHQRELFKSHAEGPYIEVYTHSVKRLKGPFAVDYYERPTSNFIDLDTDALTVSQCVFSIVCNLATL